MKKQITKYLAEIGAKGGKLSRRKITPEQQAAMQKARKADRRFAALQGDEIPGPHHHEDQTV